MQADLLQDVVRRLALADLHDQSLVHQFGQVTADGLNFGQFWHKINCIN